MPVNVSHKAAISNPFYLCGLMLVGVPRAWGGARPAHRPLSSQLWCTVHSCTELQTTLNRHSSGVAIYLAQYWLLLTGWCDSRAVNFQ